MNGNSNHSTIGTDTLPLPAIIQRWAELVALYIAMPLVMRFYIPTKFMLPTLWLAAGAILFAFTRAKLVERRALFGWDGLRPYLRVVVGRFLVAALALALLLWQREPAALLELPRDNPLLWGMIMVAYPLVSVFPQGIVYRVFYESRYAPLFGQRHRLSLVAGAALFSMAHLPFRNPWALAFTFIGGLLFLTTYRRTRRAVAANLEHALYGDFIFTFGWGKYLYHGTRALLEASA